MGLLHQGMHKKGKKIQIVLKPDIKKEIENNINEDNLIQYSKDFVQRPESELFEIKILDLYEERKHSN